MVQHSASLPNIWALQECATPPFIYLVPGAYEHRECYGLLLVCTYLGTLLKCMMNSTWCSPLLLPIVSCKQSIVGVGIACEHG